MAEDELEPLLDAKLLRLFLLLYQGGSVTRAAEQLGQSQPTVSIWLGRLRRSLNDPLFVRTAEGMLATPRAEALAGPARAALEALRQVSAPEAAFTPEATKRQFRICMTDASHITLLPRILAKLRDAAPLAQLEVVRIGSDTGQRLQSGEVDLALGFIPELEAGFYQLALYEQDWVCLANREHPRLGAELTLSEFAAEGHVGIVSGTGHALQEEALRHHRIIRRTVLELPGFLGLGAILSTTDLIVTLPRHIGTTLAGLNGLRLYSSPVNITSFTVKLHWHTRYHQDAANRWLRELCAGLFHGRNPA